MGCFCDVRVSQLHQLHLTVCESVKNGWEGTVGREIHRAELEMWRACRAAKWRGGGAGTEREESQREERRGVQLCKTANLTLT